MSVRTDLERQEHDMLAPFATFSDSSRGRRKKEKECDYRPAFQRDRDRIIHCKSFRRLKHKTQVFLSPAGDHYRTRMTHTLEVTQIARTIGRCLYLNDSLIEAIGMGHDLGHTPFGHAGEATLNELHPSGFKHFRQSVRCVEHLENEGRGLNLTWEVRDGILRHSKGRTSLTQPDLRRLPKTPEGEVLRFADIIAYTNHDLDDAIRAGIVKLSDVPKDIIRTLGRTHSKRLHTLVTDIVHTSHANDGARIHGSDEILEALEALRDFLFDEVYLRDSVRETFVRTSKIMRELYQYFMDDADRFLGLLGQKDFHFNHKRDAVDFLAGMTDRYAIELYERLFLPEPFSSGHQPL